MRTQWNDNEDEALDHLPHVDQIIYLRGIRRVMDYDTGIAGVTQAISYAWLSQLAEVRLRRGSTKRAPERMTRQALRSAFDRLEAAGLIERMTKDGEPGLVFRCLLADARQSVSRRNNPRTTPEQPRRSHPENINDDSRLEDSNNPAQNTRKYARSNPIQGTGIQEEKRKKERGAQTPDSQPSQTANARGARLTLSGLPDTWRAWVKANRPDLDADATWDAFRDYWVAQPGRAGVKADWMATWRNWCRRERSRNNGQPYLQQSKAERIAAANRAAGDEFVNGNRIIDGECQRVQ